MNLFITSLASALLLALLTISGEVCAQTTIYFDLNKTYQPCNTSTSSFPQKIDIEVDLSHAEAHPNPFKEQVHVRSNSNIATITIFEITGKELENIVVKGSREWIISGGSLPNGIYFFIIAFENGAKTSLRLCKAY